MQEKGNMGRDEEEARRKKQRKLRENFSPDTGGIWVMRFIVTDLLTPENKPKQQNMVNSNESNDCYPEKVISVSEASSPSCESVVSDTIEGSCTLFSDNSFRMSSYFCIVMTASRKAFAP